MVGFFVGQFTHCGQRNGVCARSLARPDGFRFFASFRSMLAKYLRQCAQKSSSLIIIVEISPAGKAFAARSLAAFSQLLRRARIHQLRSSSLPESFVLCIAGRGKCSVCISFSWE